MTAPRVFPLLAGVPLLVSCSTSGNVVGGAVDAGAPEVSFVDAVPLDVGTGPDAGEAGDSSTDGQAQLGPVTFSPPSGTVDPGTVTMTLLAGLPVDGFIFYTTDGTDPTHGSPVYAGPIQVTMNVAFKAIAGAPGFADSIPAAAQYIVEPFECGCEPEPVFNPPSETFVAPTLISLSLPTGSATLCYTLDGSLPTCTNGVCTGTSLTYNAATRIRIDATVTGASPPGTVTVTAIGCEAGFPSTPAEQQTYTLALAGPYIASTNVDGAGLPGWDWSATGQPLTTMTLPGDAGAPYGPFAAQQVGLLPCTGATSCTTPGYPLADFLCWSKNTAATCACASPLALTPSAPSATLPASADVSPGDTLSVVACQASTPTNAPGYYAPSATTTVQF